MSHSENSRRVALLETDERPGLVAAVSLACKDAGVSLEITTGPGHILLTFQIDDATLSAVQGALGGVAGVGNVHLYRVQPARAKQPKPATA